MFRSSRFVYPVLSRRSGGLSLGIDLFPDGKVCNFDCPYCEIFPMKGEPPFDPRELDEELREFFDVLYPSYLPDSPLRDLALSGSGEPTLSPHLEVALESMRRIRDSRAPDAALVLITNSTTLGSPRIASLLGRFVDDAGLRVWAKLDAGGAAVYARMNRSAVPFAQIVDGLRSFSRAHPLVVQTMLCGVNGKAPSDPELEEYRSLLATLRGDGARFLEIHLYTQARPSPGVTTSPLPDEFLREAAGAVASSVPGIPVRIFGAEGELPR